LKKSQLIYSVTYFNLGGLRALFGGTKPPKAPPWRRDCYRLRQIKTVFHIDIEVVFRWKDDMSTCHSKTC